MRNVHDPQPSRKQKPRRPRKWKRRDRDVHMAAVLLNMERIPRDPTRQKNRRHLLRIAADLFRKFPHAPVREIRQQAELVRDQLIGRQQAIRALSARWGEGEGGNVTTYNGVPGAGGGR